MIFKHDTRDDAQGRADELTDGDRQTVDGEVVDGYDEDGRPEARPEDPTTADTVVTEANADHDPDDDEDESEDDDTVDPPFDGPDAASTFDHAADDEDDDDDVVEPTADADHDGVADEAERDRLDADHDGVADGAVDERDVADVDRDNEPVGYAGTPHSHLTTAADEPITPSQLAEPGVGTPEFDRDDYDPTTADAVANRVDGQPVDTPAAAVDTTPTPDDDAVPVVADDEAATETPTELVPGAVTNEPGLGGWSDEDGQAYRDRWRDVQLRFVDDPRGAAAEAGTLVSEAVDAFTAALARQRQDLDSWQSSEGDDTEIFRVAVRRYRDLLDKVLGS
jgi:hypothetical protein